MSLEERQTYREKTLGISFRESMGETGTLITVYSMILDKDPVFNTPLTPPDILKEVFLNFGISFNQIKQHKL